MIIVAGHLLVDEPDRDRCVDAHRDLVRRARAFDGCLDLSISADTIDPRRINNFEAWRDSEVWTLGAARPTFQITESNRVAGT